MLKDIFKNNKKSPALGPNLMKDKVDQTFIIRNRMASDIVQVPGLRFLLMGYKEMSRSTKDIHQNVLDIIGDVEKEFPDYTYEEVKFESGKRVIRLISMLIQELSVNEEDVTVIPKEETKTE